MLDVILMACFCFLVQLMKKEDFKPPDLIKPPKHKPSKRKLSRGMVLVTVSLLGGAALLWHKDTLEETLQGVWDRVFSNPPGAS